MEEIYAWFTLSLTPLPLAADAINVKGGLEFNHGWICSEEKLYVKAKKGNRRNEA